MRLSLKGLAIASGLLWGGCILLLGLINLVAPTYGATFLQTISSIYPGYHATRSLGDVVVGTCYAFVDGALGGLLLALLYNVFAGRSAA